MPSRTVFLAKTVEEDYIVDVFDFIGSDFWAEGVTPRGFAAMLAKAGNAKRIVVRVNSPGGDVADGTTIYNLLRSEERTVRIEVQGLAASMASVIAMAGDEVVMAEGSLFMIHNPWSFAIGDAKEMEKTAELLDKIKSNMLDIYMRRANVSREKVAEMMDDETWMTPVEAVKYGFADSVIGADAEAVAALPSDRAFATLRRYAKTPSQLLSQLETPDGLQLVAAMVRQPKKEKAIMDREKLIAALGLPADASDDDILAAVSAGKTTATVGEMVPRADVEALRSENARLKAEAKAEAERREKEEREAFDFDVETAVDAAVSSGKIPPASAEYHKKTCKAAGRKGLADFRAYIDSAPRVINDSQTRDAETRNGKLGSPAASLGSDDAKKMCKMLGISAQDLADAAKDIREDEETYPPEAYRYATAIG